MNPMRVGPAAIAELADVAYATNLTSGPLIQFFNSCGLQRPMVRMLESKRNFALEAWAELNEKPKFGEAVAQLLSPHFWPDDEMRIERIVRLNKILKVDGCEIVERDGHIRFQALDDSDEKAGRSIGRRPSYSMRNGRNPHLKGFPLSKIKEVFKGFYSELEDEGFFQESFGYYCIDAGDVPGAIKSPAADILLTLRKDNLWPIASCIEGYSEDDFFDIIEYLFQVVSKPLTGSFHNYSNCGMHWQTFDKYEGQQLFRRRINEMLTLYEKQFELSEDGEILLVAEAGLEPLFDAKVPTSDANVSSRVEAALLSYRRHGSTVEDRRKAVRDLVDVLEYLRAEAKVHMKDDERDLFNIANNFGIRHHNQKQKTKYDQALWLSWMFYVYLATIHLVVRKIEQDKVF